MYAELLICHPVKCQIPFNISTNWCILVITPIVYCNVVSCWFNSEVNSHVRICVNHYYWYLKYTIPWNILKTHAGISTHIKCSICRIPKVYVKVCRYRISNIIHIWYRELHIWWIVVANIIWVCYHLTITHLL
jgi:hypothetical protein